MSHNTAGAYHSNPGQAPKKSHLVRNFFIGAAALTLGLMGGCGIIVASLGGSEPLEFSEPSPTATAKPSKGKVTTPPVPRKVVIEDGIWLVGPEVKPGTYRSSSQDSCYWERLSSTDGDAVESTIANGIGPNQTVTIKKTDVAFKSQMCGGWVRVR